MTSIEDIKLMEGYIIYIIIGVVVFVVAGGGIWYFVSRNQEK